MEQKKQYKYEMHCHSSEVSCCGQVNTTGVIDRLIKNGYDGMVITNHYSEHTFWNMMTKSAKEKADHFLSAYNIALKYAPENFTVLLGMEFTFQGTGNDFLLYGVSTEFVYNLPDNVLTLDIEYLKKLTEEYGILLVQAHPLRSHIVLQQPQYLDGVELYNYCDRELEHKWLEQFAIDNNKIILSGSDFHHDDQQLRGGIATTVPIRSNKQLVDILKNRNYKTLPIKE